MPPHPSRRTVPTPSHLRKQLALHVPVADFVVLRDEAIRRGVTLSDLLRELMEPGYTELMSARRSA